jgi:hypothetical protein
MGALMPTFETPEPITLTLEVGVGDVRIAASDRADTHVEITPSNPAKHADVEAARTTQVDFASGTLTVRAPRRWTRYKLFGGADSVDVRIEIPSGSVVHVDAVLAAVSCTGQFLECLVKTGFGDVVLGDCGPLTARSGAGNVTVHRAFSHADVTTGSGNVRIDELDGDGVVRSSNGDVWIGSAGNASAPDIRLKSSRGRIAVDHCSARIDAKTAAGDVRIGGVTAGAVVVATSYGAVEVGIADGIAAWLDLGTSFGNVVNDLEESGPPASGLVSVEVKARTSFGDITIRRVQTAVPEAKQVNA